MAAGRSKSLTSTSSWAPVPFRRTVNLTVLPTAHSSMALRGEFDGRSWWGLSEMAWVARAVHVKWVLAAGEIQAMAYIRC